MKRLPVLAALLWGALGARVLCEVTFHPRRGPARPRIPFSELPFDLFGPEWQGEDAPLPPRVEAVAGVADYVHRRYRRGAHTFVLYAGFLTDGALRGVHHPAVCFPTHGFELDDPRRVALPGGAAGAEVPLHEYVWRDGLEWERPAGYVLTTFYYNGRFDPDVGALKLAGRFPGVRYYAVVTLAGDTMGSLDETRSAYLDLARQAIPAILEHLPRESREDSERGAPETSGPPPAAGMPRSARPEDAARRPASPEGGPPPAAPPEGRAARPSSPEGAREP